jgi:hypothetical protein
MAYSFALQEYSYRSNSRRLPAFIAGKYIGIEREDQALEAQGYDLAYGLLLTLEYPSVILIFFWKAISL